MEQPVAPIKESGAGKHVELAFHCPRELFKRHDRNAVPRLGVLTEEIVSCEQIMVWWFNTKVALHNGSAAGYGSGIKSSNLGSQSQASEHACSSLCDEVVIL
ncbi:zinc finger SWIM domain-containing protein 8 homolog [Daphnia carinata]|uniref:zinc finger SWIM domain-containing protein 8 homolog n=1 Tax=Daphnia carinata TaxID=120202 RepID=UPI0028690B86|nr:zinc finger SWIM domain-containing protein 8 homolog [Daphnia carinata]